MATSFQSLRAAAACVGITDPSFSVVGDVFGCRRGSAYVDASGKVALELTPELPLLHIDDGSNAAVTWRDEPVSLRAQMDLMAGPKIALNLRPILPYGIITFSTGSLPMGPPNPQIVGELQASTDPDATVASEITRRVSAALLVARQIFAQAPEPIGLYPVRWIVETDSTADDTLSVDYNSKVPAAMERAAQLRALLEDFVDGPGGDPGLPYAIQVFFLRQIDGSDPGDTSMGFSGIGQCLPRTFTKTVRAEVVKVVRMVLDPAGSLARAAIMAMIPAATAISVADFSDGDWQRGKTLAHELGHYMGLNPVHWKEAIAGVEASHIGGRVMAQGGPRVVEVDGVKQLDVFFTKEEKNDMLNSSCSDDACV